VVEVWKPIKNYPGYEVSNFGRVRTHNKTSFTKKHGIRHWKDRILKLRGTSPCGSRIMLWNEKSMREFLVARLTAFTFFNEDINNQKLTVNHKDGNRYNNSSSNLEWVTKRENCRHAWDNNLIAPSYGMRGKTNPNGGRKGKPFRIVETGEVFNTLEECEQAIDGNNRHINDCLRGRQRTHRGYHFEYVNN
jgi:hypothetical protein